SRPRAARAACRRRDRDQALAGARARRARRRRLRPHATAADDPPGAGRSMSVYSPPTWADVIEENAAEPTTARRLIAQLRACEISALAFCRLLERWARGDAKPSTPGERQASLRRAAERVETALAGLEEPLKRYLLELEAETLEGRSWYGAPGAAELVDWEPVLTRAGVRAPAARV